MGDRAGIVVAAWLQLLLALPMLTPAQQVTVSSRKEALNANGNCMSKILYNINGTSNMNYWCVTMPQMCCYCRAGFFWTKAVCRQVGACDSWTDASSSSCTCIFGIPPAEIECMPKRNPRPLWTTANLTDTTWVMNKAITTVRSTQASSSLNLQDLKTFHMTLTVEEVFNSALNDPNSMAHKSMSDKLLPSLSRSYQNIGSRFVKAAITNFESGSVLAFVEVSGYNLTATEVITMTSVAIDALIASAIRVSRSFNVNGTATDGTTERLKYIFNQSKELQNESKETVQKAVPILLWELTAQTSSAQLTPYRVHAASAALGQIALAAKDKRITFQHQVAADFLETSSNLLNRSNAHLWRTLQERNKSNSADLLKSIEIFMSRINTTSGLGMATRGNDEWTFNITSANILLEGTVYGNSTQGAYSKTFLNAADATSVTIDSQQLSNVVNGDLYIVNILFTTLAGILPLRLAPELSDGSGANGVNYAVGSYVLSTIVNCAKSGACVTDIRFHFPVTEPKVAQSNNFKCTFWDTQFNNGRGGWSDFGCQLTSSPPAPTIGAGGTPLVDGRFVSCRCNHTTSFSILVSRDTIDDPTLSAISGAGIAVSIASLLAALAVEAATWRSAGRHKNSRVRHLVLVNLCCSLLFANVWFVAAASPAAISNPALCATIAFLVHLGYLSLFFWMLCEGLFLLYLVVIIYDRMTERQIWALAFALGYGLPAAIAVITIVVTHPRGAYLRGGACWLDWKRSRALLAFVVPAFVICCVNLAVLAMVVKKVACRSGAAMGAAMSGKPAVRVKQVVRSVAVLTPLLGVTWGLGIFAFSAGGRGSLALHYLFAILNSLQGLFILLFDCLFDKEIQKELRKKLGLCKDEPVISSSGLVGIGVVQQQSHSTDSTDQEMKRVAWKQPSTKCSVKVTDFSSSD
ncbi:adhesion G protein-coupled receptor F5-like [Petromyzon marinus]|uniref:Adhesion G protein-coupled receptor F4-like n=1 Tax=Petromyzon marinus TaxID=7757 RepID=A0AAJ7XHZ1_PETMA|nr:adhesion G protein-coupled receptor F4-like [Petromyzon marinus]